MKSLWPFMEIRQAAVQDCSHSDRAGQPGLLGLRPLGWRASDLIAFHATDLIEDVCNSLRYLSLKGGWKGNSRGCANSNICKLLHSRGAVTAMQRATLGSKDWGVFLLFHFCIFSHLSSSFCIKILSHSIMGIQSGGACFCQPLSPLVEPEGHSPSGPYWNVALSVALVSWNVHLHLQCWCN